MARRMILTRLGACPSIIERPGYDEAMPDRLYFTDSDEANELIANDPMALLIGFSLDQHWSVQI
jgi:hypothetical protein